MKTKKSKDALTHVANEDHILQLMADFSSFMEDCGLRESSITKALTSIMEEDHRWVAFSCPPQEGKTTWIITYLAWQLIRDPWLNIIYVSYNEFRANSVSRKIRSLVKRFTPLKPGSSNISQWQTREGGGLVAAGRGTGVTGFSCDLLVIDDPIKDMKEAQSENVRKAITEHFDSVLLTRMSSTGRILCVATRWHKDDLISHLLKTPGTFYVNIPAKAEKNDYLGRRCGTWLTSVQNRSSAQWLLIKKSQGSYVWQALYQGNPVITGGNYINVDKLDVIPWDSVVYSDSHGFLLTLDRALVIQSWDLAFKDTNDFVAGQVWANISGTWILLDRIHERATFTRTVSLVQQMAAKWPQTAKIYVEDAANGAALIDTLKTRAALIKPIKPLGSKESRALATQPLVESGRVKIVDNAYSQEFFDELRTFPAAAHDDQVDAFTQALLSGKADYFDMR